MTDTLTLADLILPVPPIATGNAALDALLDRLETDGVEETAAEIMSRTAGGPALFARLEQLAAGVHDLSASGRRASPRWYALRGVSPRRLAIVEALACEVRDRKALASAGSFFSLAARSTGQLELVLLLGSTLASSRIPEALPEAAG